MRRFALPAENGFSNSAKPPLAEQETTSALDVKVSSSTVKTIFVGGVKVWLPLVVGVSEQEIVQRVRNKV